MRTRLREIRRAKEISQQAVADALGVHVNTYMKWEKTPEKIPIHAAYALSELLKKPIDDIFFEFKNYKM